MASDGRTYRVGVIGTGRIASTIEDEVADGPFHIFLPYSHAGAYAAVATTELVAAADTNAERLGAFARRWHVPAVYADYRAMLQHEQLDIVSICTPTRSHRQIALNVAESGVGGVFLEKPIAQSLREADAMIAAFERHGVRAAVNHTRTYDPYYRRVRALIAAGAIGDLHAVVAHWHEGFLFGGTHLFDLVRYLVGAEAAWVFGTLDTRESPFDPGGSGMIRFANGVDAFINSRVGHAAPPELDIVGATGRIRIGGTLFPELYTKDPHSPRGEVVQRVFPAAIVGTSAMTVAVQELVRAIETGDKPGSDMADSRADLELAVALHLSHQRTAPVTLPVTELDYTIKDPWGRS